MATGDKTVGYETMGDGPHKVLALHGWFGDHTTFRPLRDALSLSEFTYASVAYRGYGLSRHLAGTYTMAEISTDAIAVADALGWNEFSLIGHSMGGMAVQRILIDAPGRVRKLVAVTPVPASGVPFDPQTAQLFEGAADDLDNRRAIIDFSTGNRLSRAWIDHMARYSDETADRKAFAAYLTAWTKTDIHAGILGNPVPVRVIVGAHDGALTADVMTATYLAWYPNASLEVMTNAGHYPMNETPVALATSIEAFLRAA
ncbi:MAG: alpha/beta hydrolase [Xanthobacteraceae bacterium]|nr:alpha/beta hydrolase [Xanthobacteraceae bacterium]